MAEEERRYLRDDGGNLLVRPLDGLTLLYHRPSGATHILDSPMPEILSVLAAGPQSAVILLDRLSADYDVDDRDGAIVGLIDHLEALCALGLARAV